MRVGTGFAGQRSHGRGSKREVRSLMAARMCSREDSEYSDAFRWNKVGVMRQSRRVPL